MHKCDCHEIALKGGFYRRYERLKDKGSSINFDNITKQVFYLKNRVEEVNPVDAIGSYMVRPLSNIETNNKFISPESEIKELDRGTIYVIDKMYDMFFNLNCMFVVGEKYKITLFNVLLKPDKMGVERKFKLSDFEIIRK